MKILRARPGDSDTRFAIIFVAVVLAFSAISLGFIGVIQTDRAQIQPQLDNLKSALSTLQANPRQNIALPVMNQTTTIRAILMTWYLSPQAHQDRFDPPYNIVVNATVPGLINDLTGQNFTTNATNNSPGVVVTGSVGKVSATYSFVAKYAGVFEFVCTYHAQVGMIGYLVVLPNAAYGTKSPAGHPSTSQGAAKAEIIPGAGSNTTSNGYSPGTITVTVSGNNTVTWLNNDNAPHTVTANDGSFASGNIAPGDSFSFTFTRPGTYAYHCIYHPWMTGIIVVK
jgi:plastocyanin